MPSLLSLGPVIVHILVLTSGLWLFHYYTCEEDCSQSCSSNIETSHSGYFQYGCAGKPHQSTWSSWWHPQRTDGVPEEHKQGAGATTHDWNILYHLGGNGPWVEKVIDVVDGGIAVPEGCRVEQVHMVRCMFKSWDLG